MKKQDYHDSGLETVKLPPCDLAPLINDMGHPIVFCRKNGRDEKCYTHTDIVTLLKEFPSLKEKKHWTVLAKLVNFLAKGLEFEVITDPASYREEYSKQTEEGTDPFSISPLATYGIFNLSEVKAPAIGKDGATFIFYAKNKIPYRVTCRLDEHPMFRYELLPYKT